MSEKVTVALVMLFGICAVVGVVMAGDGSRHHHTSEHLTGLLLAGIGFGGWLLGALVGMVLGIRGRRKP